MRRGLAVSGVAAASALAIGFAIAAERAPLPTLDLDRIFRCRAVTVSPAECAEARALILANCNACHTFFRLVRRQHQENEWRTYVAWMGDLAKLPQPEIELITRYLGENFRPGLPPPELPPEYALVP